MRVINPKPGLIVAFRYLWADEHAAGHDQALKLRPCLVVAVEPLARGQRVTLMAVTHYPQMNKFVEVPKGYLREAGLDGHGQYVVTGEVNVVRWPSRNVRAILGRVPEGFMKEVKEAVARDADTLRVVDHEEMGREVVRSYRGR